MRGVLVSGIAGLFLAYTGAFGTIEAPLGLRLVYWVAVLVGGAVWATACTRVTERFVDLDDRPWLEIAVLTAVISGPLTVAVWFVTGLAFTGRVYDLAVLPYMLGPVAAVTVVVTAVNVFLSRVVQTHATPGIAAPAAFLDRLPPKLRGARLLAVQSEDHYLRLHTDRGSDLILMRLSDALKELEGLEGAQTHRSWWVARDAVRDVARGDGRATLTLDGGVRAPVSRRHGRALRAAGWY
ncbi:LytTR family DNA-binding domain-containing protein [Brevundimonas balnearis]|uniref:LytTR family DNA-binding domain-containing protein n=1 Tax=Brevundimonas balnearis TaxID=1572858 RepID=A0ABV6R342_9CAUL